MSKDLREGSDLASSASEGSVPGKRNCCCKGSTADMSEVYQGGQCSRSGVREGKGQYDSRTER